MAIKLLRIDAVAQRIGGCSRSSVWRFAKSLSGFPKPVKIAPGVTGWIESEVDDWLAARVAAARGEEQRGGGSK